MPIYSVSPGLRIWWEQKMNGRQSLSEREKLKAAVHRPGLHLKAPRDSIRLPREKSGVCRVWTRRVVDGKSWTNQWREGGCPVETQSTLNGGGNGGGGWWWWWEKDKSDDSQKRQAAIPLKLNIFINILLSTERHDTLPLVWGLDPDPCSTSLQWRSIQ